MKFLIKNIIKDPNFIKEKEANSRQKLKQVYLRSGLIYLTKTKNNFRKKLPARR